MAHVLLVPDMLLVGDRSPKFCDYLSHIRLIVLNYLFRSGMGCPAIEEEGCIERFIGCMAVISIFE